MQQKVAHAPTPHSTPMLDSPEMRRSDDLAMQVDDTADSSKAAVAATPGSGGAKSGSIAPQSSGSLKVHVTGSPPAASPSKVRWLFLHGLALALGSIDSYNSLLGAEKDRPGV
jgi:hypothetical protein